MGPDDAGGSVMCAYARAICSSYSSAFPARATPLCSFTSDWSPDHQGVGHCLIASWVSCAKDVKSLLERLARRLNSIIVENFHKYNDCHKNYRTIRGESQSDSSRHREVVVLHRCGEMRSALGGTYPGDLVGLATLLGYTSLNTTRIYSQPTVEQLSMRV